MGQAGVTKALEILAGELDKTMALCGETNINNVGRHNLLDLQTGLAPVSAKPNFKQIKSALKPASKKQA